MLQLADAPLTLCFNRDTLYTFRRGPNAGRALKYIGQGAHPFEDHVHVATADGLPFNSGEGKTHNTAVARPHDLVVK